MTKFGLDIPKAGYGICYKHDEGWIGDQIIKKQLKMGIPAKYAEYTHVEMSLGGQHTICVELPRTHPEDIVKRYKGRQIIIFRLKDPKQEYGKEYWRKIAKAAMWSATFCNTVYDVPGVLGFNFEFLKHLKNNNFCSENYIESIRKEFPEVAKEIDSNKFLPAHPLVLDDFQIVWEGKIA